MVTRLTNYTKQFWILLSTDDMDTLGSHNGDEVIVIDRDERYVFDEENRIWRQIPMSGGGGGSARVAIGEFTMLTPEVTPTITHNLGTKKVAVLIYPVGNVVADSTYQTFYFEGINVPALLEGIEWHLDFSNYNSGKQPDHQDVDFSDPSTYSNLRTGLRHISPYTSQTYWYQADSNVMSTPGNPSGPVFTDNTVRVMKSSNKWAIATYKYFVWALD